MEYAIIKSILPDDIFEIFKKRSRNAIFKDIPAGKGDTLRLAKPDSNIVNLIKQRIEAELKLDLSLIISFVRLNHNFVNNTFRVHSDTVIEGQKPDVAAVFYFDTVKDTGTALFEHPTYGRLNKDYSESAIFKDNELWHPYMRYESEANSAFVYNADLYHGRYPWEAYGDSQKNGRIVIVMFMRIVNER